MNWCGAQRKNAAAVYITYGVCERSLHRAHLQKLGFNPEYRQANYNAYCMILYHNQLHGTDYDAFF